MAEVIKILLVDDDEVDRMAVQRVLKAASFPVQITEAINCADTFSKFNQETFDCVLLDYRLPDGNGLELVIKIRDRNIQIPLIVLTGQGDDQIAVELLKAGASDYLAKTNVSPGRLAQVIQNALRVHKAEAEAAIANQQRETLLKQREDFMSRLTHDMQTPLFAANRMLQFFLENMFGDIPPGVAQRIPFIIRSNHNLLQMVSNIVEVYSHEAEGKNLDFGLCDVQDILEEVVQELLPLAIGKKIDLSLKVQNPGGLQVLGDCLELRRVFINLIGNSIKFTDEGHIQVKLSQVNEPSKKVVITVQDTGFGIAPEVQSRLFERFRAGDHKRSNAGLGLYLARRIVELHQGSIAFHSELGVGSTFMIHLPQHLP